MIGTQISKYKIVSELGRGGMGVVYKAYDIRLNRPVALKFIPPNRKESTIIQRRLIQEAQAASALNHPNILTVYDVDEHLGKNYIVMEFVDGESLEETLENGPVEENEIIRIVSEIASGLKIAHLSGIIHRDIKPANVMMTSDGRVKIMDFGLAKVADSTSLTETGGVLGTAAYMSPEQARGEEVDPRTDLWSLGVIVYEMIAGCRPFEGPYLPALMYAVLNLEPAALHADENKVSQSLIQLAFRCLEKDRDLRYASTVDFLSDLSAISAGAQSISPLIPYRKSPKNSRGRREQVGTLGSMRSAVSQRINKNVLVALLVFAVIVLVSVPLSIRYNLWGTTGLRVPLVAVLPIEAEGAGLPTYQHIVGLQHDIIRQVAGIQGGKPTYSTLSPEEISSRQITDSSWSKILPEGSIVIKSTIQSFASSIQLQFNRVGKDGSVSTESIRLDATIRDMLIFQNQAGLALAGWIIPGRVADPVTSTLSPGSTILPQAYEAYLEGRGYLELSRSERELELAVNMFQEALRLDPTFAQAHLGLGESYLRLYDYSGDETWLSRAETSADNANSSSSGAAPAEVLQGLIEMEQANPASAVLSFNRAINLNPNNPLTHNRIGQAYFALRRPSQAEESYRKVIDLRPGNWEGYFNLGRFFELTDRFGAAAAQYRLATQLNGDRYISVFRLATVQESAGDIKNAIQSYQRAAALEETNTSLLKLADIHFYALRDYLGSASFLEKALEKNDLDFRIWDRLASSYYWIPEQREKAESAWMRSGALAEAVLQIRDNNHEALGASAFALVRLNRKEEALERIGLLLRSQITDADVALQVAKLLEITGSRDSSLVYVNQSLNLGMDLEYIVNSPWLSALISDPRFSTAGNSLQTDSEL